MVRQILIHFFVILFTAFWKLRPKSSAFRMRGRHVVRNCSPWRCFKLSFSTWCTKWNTLLSRLFRNSWLVCLLHLLLTNAPLVKVNGNPISNGIVFKNELTYLSLLEAYKRVEKSQAILEHQWWPSEAASRLVSLSNYCLWCVCVCVFFFRFPEVERMVYAA